jgi:hypothetical protein
MSLLLLNDLSDVVEEHGRTSGFHRDGGTWYPHQACRFLKLKHHIHSFVYKDEKSVIERTMQYIKGRTKECFDDDYFPCRKKKCKLKHVIFGWIYL